MIRDMKEIYKEEYEEYITDGQFFSCYNYQPMIESFADEILVQVDDSSYQGDTRVLLKEGNKIGHLIFGWGSCLGCDALQACENIGQVQELANNLYSDIIWFDSEQEALDYFNNHDWEGDYCWHQEETHKYITECKKYLQKVFDKR